MDINSKIIFRRGSAWTLPGKPLGITITSTPSDGVIIGSDGFGYEMTDGLDEGELGFATDTSRLFIGVDPAAPVPQTSRVAYPFRNIEVLDTNSREGFNAMSGARMKEGGGSDYYSASLIPTNYGDIQDSPPDPIGASADYLQLDIIITALGNIASAPPVVKTFDGWYWRITFSEGFTGGTLTLPTFITLDSVATGFPQTWTDSTDTGTHWEYWMDLDADGQDGLYCKITTFRPSGSHPGASIDAPYTNPSDPTDTHNGSYAEMRVYVQHWDWDDRVEVVYGYSQSGSFGSIWQFNLTDVVDNGNQSGG